MSDRARRRRRTAGEPAPLTDADVLAAARGDASEVARRIARHSRSTPIGKLVSEKDAPPRITAAEMREIRQRRRLPKSVRERLARTAQPAASVEPSATEKESPKSRPPARG